MMREKDDISNREMSLSMTCIFITMILSALKFVGYIDWSWWWVLSPVAIPVIVLIGFLIWIYTK